MLNFVAVKITVYCVLFVNLTCCFPCFRFVYRLMGLFFIIAWPLSKLLDCLLGHEHSTFFRRAELKVLVDLHGTGEGNTEQLSLDEVMIIKVAQLFIFMNTNKQSRA